MKETEEMPDELIEDQETCVHEFDLWLLDLTLNKLICKKCGYEEFIDPGF